MNKPFTTVIQKTLDAVSNLAGQPALIEFKPFQKLPRLFREMWITEKIDGTNACIHIGESGEFLTGSRTRWITPESDNYGFSRWAHDNKEELMKLGPGTHFGEWWGSGIQRNYGLTEKRFSLFNAHRWHSRGQAPIAIGVDKFTERAPDCCHVVPVLFLGGVFDEVQLRYRLDCLRLYGSVAVPGFMKPEGIVVFHSASGVAFKVTLENDEKPKGA